MTCVVANTVPEVGDAMLPDERGSGRNGTRSSSLSQPSGNHVRVEHFVDFDNVKHSARRSGTVILTAVALHAETSKVLLSAVMRRRGPSGGPRRRIFLPWVLERVGVFNGGKGPASQDEIDLHMGCRSEGKECWS